MESKGRPIIAEQLIESLNGLAITSAYMQLENGCLYNVSPMFNSGEIPTLIEWKNLYEVYPIFLPFESHSNTSEKTNKRQFEIHRNLRRGFGIRCNNGNIQISRRCKTCISTTRQGDTGELSAINRPKTTKPPFEDENDEIVFNLEKYIEDVEVKNKILYTKKF